jgi:hypothetical protein
MPSQPKNLDWIRSVDPKNLPTDFGHRLYQCLQDLTTNDNVVAQQGNFSLDGNPTAPPQPQALNMVPHPQGVQYQIQHEGEFYQGINYEIDMTAQGQTHTFDVGSSRNGVLPVGPVTASYQVRARYPNGKSGNAVAFSQPVRGASVSQVTLLPSQGAGTTRPSQPPGFGGPYRSSNGAPPVRRTK